MADTTREEIEKQVYKICHDATAIAASDIPYNEGDATDYVAVAVLDLIQSETTRSNLQLLDDLEDVINQPHSTHEILAFMRAKRKHLRGNTNDKH